MTLASMPDGTIDTSLRSTLYLRVPLDQHLKLSFMRVMDTIYDYENSRAHSLVQSWGREKCREVGIPFLAAIPDRILQCIIQGTLASGHASGDLDLIKLYGEPAGHVSDTSFGSSSGSNNATTDWLRNGQRTAPGHYIRYLVDEKGQAPTPNELLQAVGLMRKYAEPTPEHSQLAQEVDSARDRVVRSSEANIRNGLYYFICTHRPTRKRSDVRSRAVVAFCDAIEQRLASLPAHLLDQPDIRPLAYVGYTLHFSKLQQDHDEDSTSYIMGLLQHVCCHLQLQYSWTIFATSWAVSADEARLGEIIVNALARGYHDTSYGVAPHPAGLNCSSADFKDKLYQDVQACWRDAMAFRVKRTPFMENLTRETAHYKAVVNKGRAVELLPDENRSLCALVGAIDTDRQALHKQMDDLAPIEAPKSEALASCVAALNEIGSAMRAEVQTCIDERLELERAKQAFLDKYKAG
jgi:hypothetical protein